MSLSSLHGDALPAFGRLARRRDTAREASPSTMAVAVFLATHLLAGALMKAVPALAVLHWAAALALAGVVAVTARRPVVIACAAAYLVGAEVLWRTTEGALFYESAKYAIVGLLLFAMIRAGDSRIMKLAALYFALLLPSAFITLTSEGFAGSRELFSQDLSGPLSIAVAITFFANHRFSSHQLVRIFVSFLGPAAAIAGVTLYSTYTADYIKFATESNFTTSGDYGPNQVSSALALGALLVAFSLLVFRLPRGLATTLALTAGLMMTQSVMTFSRNGIYSAGIALVILLLHLWRNRRARTTALAAGAVGVVLAYFVLVPKLNDFTRGALLERFASVGSSNRHSVALTDLAVWRNNPIFGTGPGLAAAERARLMGEAVAAHTEYTRVLAEHGLFGLASIAVLSGMALLRYRQALTPRSRALAGALFAWSFLYLAVNATRTAAPAFALALPFANLRRESPGPASFRRAL